MLKAPGYDSLRWESVGELAFLGNFEHFVSKKTPWSTEHEIAGIMGLNKSQIGHGLD